MTDTKLLSKEEARERALGIIDELAQDFKGKVSDIENGIKVTQDHYGEYLSFLGNPGIPGCHVKLMACAVIKAGDIIGKNNRAGVKSALKIMGY